MTLYTTSYQSPIGQIVIKGTEEGISSVSFYDQPEQFRHRLLPVCLQQALDQLHEYFCHQRREFDLLLNIQQGTPFQQKVWNALLGVRWGETITYAQLAIRLGQPEALRAVGFANSQNPFLIILPCHRVVGSTGLLTGYAGGLLRKQWLLQHEQESIQLEIF